jgi:hypothetical protein
VLNDDVYPVLKLGSTAPTSWTPYENICPISGHTGAEIEQRGKNLLNMTDVLDDACINTTNKNVSSIGGANVFYADVPKNTTITYSADKGNRCVIVGYKTRPSTIMGATYDVLFINGASQNLIYTFDTGDCEFVVLYLNRDQANKPTQIQVEIGSTATDYEPYTGNQISVDWEDEAGTVYGGTLTINPDRTGTLVVDSVKSVTTWGAGSSSGAVTALQRKAFYPQPLIGHLLNMSEKAKCKCNVAPIVSGTNVVGFWPYATNQFYLTLPADTSNSTVVEFFFPIADPIEYSITEAEVSGILGTLYGTNNIWSSTGDTEVTYPADTKLYIDGKIAEAIAALQS